MSRLSQIAKELRSAEGDIGQPVALTLGGEQRLMSRIIEIVLFLTPFCGLLAWRLLFPAPSPPHWLMGGLVGFVVLMLGALIWLRHIDASDAGQAYVPAQLHDNRIVPAHPATPP